MNKTKFTFTQMVAAFALLTASINVQASGTSTIIDAIEAEKNTMSEVVSEYQQINHDFAQANKMEQALIEQISTSPEADVTLEGKKMIQKKLSGINQAIQQVDQLFESSERMDVLIGQLIQQTSKKANPNATQQEKREQYNAAAKQASGTYQTLNFLLQTMPNLNSYERSELENTLYASKSNLDKYALQRGEVNLEDALTGLRKVFGSLSTKLLVERQNLTNLSNHYISLDYTLVAVDTENKLTTLINGLQQVMGKIGSYSQAESAIQLRDSLLQRRSRNSIVSPSSNNSRYDAIAAKIDAGEL